jgi:mutator protein MutT
MKLIDVAIAVVKRDRKILICQRKIGVNLPGFWEFPGGKREAGETLEACLSRELMEEVAISVTVIEKLTPVEHLYDQTRVILHPFLCDHLAGEPIPIECQRVKWIDALELSHFEFPPANDVLLKEIAIKIRTM